MKFAGLVSLALLLACSVGEKTVSGRPPDLAPFKTVEAEFIRWLFLSPGRGWQTYQVPGSAAIMIPALESFRSHPQEVLPVLICGPIRN